MTKDEALKLAEVIEHFDRHDENVPLELLKEISATLRALAQPEQEPFGYFKATPFGWTDCAETDEGAIALYQAPPQRTWVGLTEDQLRKICGSVPSMREAVREGEIILKQQNGYAEEKGK